MAVIAQNPAPEEALMGRRLLALLPKSGTDRTRSILEILEAAKQRWSLTIHVVCQATDRRSFEPLAAPHGRLYVPPSLLEAAAWESNFEAVTELQSRIRQAEIAAQVPMGRNVLAAAHSVGRSFSLSLSHSHLRPLFLKITQDNVEPFRIMRRFFRFAEQVLDEAKPDFVFSIDWAAALHSAFWMTANQRSIACVALRNSKIHSKRTFWTTDRLMLNTTGIDKANTSRMTGVPLNGTGMEFVKTFREAPRTIDYIAERWRWDHSKRSFVRWHLDTVRTILQGVVSSWRGEELPFKESGFVRLYRYYRRRFLSYYHKRFFWVLSSEELARTKYVYFPMHKERELAQTFQAAPWHDQRNTIRVLASILPAGYKLLVREHRFNYSLRPTRLCREFSNIPNVVMIDPFDSQFKYIQHADLVVTENGSTGWEALLMGRRLITLSHAFYDGAGLGTKVWDPDELNAAVLESLARPAVRDQAVHDASLAYMAEAELETSFLTDKRGIAKALNLLLSTVGPDLPEPGQTPIEDFISSN